MDDIDPLFQQFFSGENFPLSTRILDAGCGYGRNIKHLIKEGSEVNALDIAEDDVEHVKEYSLKINPAYDVSSFRVENIEENSFTKGSFDLILCHSVLHFAKDEKHFMIMLEALEALLKTNGFLYLVLRKNTFEDALKKTSFLKTYLPTKSHENDYGIYNHFILKKI